MSRFSVVSGLLGLLLIAVPRDAVAFAKVASTASERNGDKLVAVLKGSASDVSCQEIVTRIVAELMADGIPVIALACSAAHASCLPESGVHPFATVLVERRVSGRVVEVRAGESIEDLDAPGTPVPAETGHVRRLTDSDAAGGPAALAIRAVELLKAMLLELDDASPPATETKGAVVQRADVDAITTVAKTAPPSSSVVPTGRYNLTLDFGVAMLGGFGGLRTAFGPSIAVGRRSSEHVLLSGVLEGPTYAPEQISTFGSAKVRHEMLLLRADLLGLFWDAVVLRAGIGTGIYHIHVDGRGVFSDVNGLTDVVRGSGGGFAVALAWSVGMVANLRSDLGIFLDGSMFVLTPTPLVSLNTVEVGRAGNPGLVLSMGVEFRL